MTIFFDACDMEMSRGTDERATGACPEEPPGIPGLGVQRRENAPRRLVRRPKENSQFAHDSITHELRYSLHTVDVAKIDVYNNFCKRGNIASPVRKRIFLRVLFCKVVSWCDKIIGKSYDEIRV